MSAAATATQGSLQREQNTAPAGSANLLITQGSAEPIQEDIARLAYALWQNRGCPIGSAEIDWFEAEQKLRLANR